MRKLLRYLMLSAGLYCQPPEEESEDPCANGEVLFEDEFEGSELDEVKWENYCTSPLEYSLSEGVLEMRANKNSGACVIQSRSTYTLDDLTLCFEARWKVREREGTSLGIALRDENYESVTGFELGAGHNYLGCVSAISGEYEVRRCDVDVTQWNTTNFSMDNSNRRFYVNKNEVTNMPTTPTDSPQLIDITCSSEDNNEKSCTFDYIRILQK